MCSKLITWYTPFHARCKLCHTWYKSIQKLYSVQSREEGFDRWTVSQTGPGELVNVGFPSQKTFNMYSVVGFPSQKTFNMYSVFISWHHHVTTYPWILKYLLEHSCPFIKCVLLSWANSEGRLQNSNKNTETTWHNMQEKYSLYWIKNCHLMQYTTYYKSIKEIYIWNSCLSYRYIIVESVKTPFMWNDSIRVLCEKYKALFKTWK